MAEYVYPLDQTVTAGQNVLLQDSIPCNKGYVIHRNGSGILTLRGIVNNPCARFARYFVEFNGNIALPEGGTPGEISLALAIDGEPLQTSKARVTPTVAEAFPDVLKSDASNVQPVGSVSCTGRRILKRSPFSCSILGFGSRQQVGSTFERAETVAARRTNRAERRSLRTFIEQYAHYQRSSGSSGLS